MQSFRGSSLKYVHWHLRSPWDTLMHIFRGSFSISLFTIHVFYSSLCEPKLVLSSITKKGEIESASRPLFGALKKLCAEIKWKNQEEVERKVPKFKLFCGGIHGRFNSNFQFEIEYRTTVLSREMHLIDLGCQSASYEMTFTLERHFFHSQKHLCLITLH